MAKFPRSAEEEQELLADVRRLGAVALGDGRFSLMTRNHLLWSKRAMDRLRLQVGLHRTTELASLIQASGYWLVDRHLGYAPLPMNNFDALIHHVSASRVVCWLAGDEEEAAQNDEELRVLMECIGAPTMADDHAADGD